MSNDMNISKMFMSKKYNLQKILFGVTCNALKTCLSKDNKESKLQRNPNSNF